MGTMCSVLFLDYVIYQTNTTYLSVSLSPQSSPSLSQVHSQYGLSPSLFISGCEKPSSHFLIIHSDVFTSSPLILSLSLIVILNTFSLPLSLSQAWTSQGLIFLSSS